MRDRSAEQALRVLQVIVVAVVMSVISFAAIAVFLRIGGMVETKGQVARPMALALGALIVVEVAVYLLIRRAMLGKLHRSWQAGGEADVPAEHRMQILAVLTIIGTLLVEAPSVFATVIFLLSGNWVALGVPALGLLLLALLFPTRVRFGPLVDSG